MVQVNDLVGRMGGRKFVLCLGCGAVTTLLLWFGKLDAAAYTTVILGTVGAFIVGNVAAQKKGGEQ